MADEEERARERMEKTGGQARIQDLPETERPREKLARLGAPALTDAELLAIFFRTGFRGLNAIAMSRLLIEKYGSLQALSRLAVEELVGSNKGIGSAKAAELVAAFEMGRRLARERLGDISLKDPEVVYELMGREMRLLAKETLRVLLMNARCRLVKVEMISTGSLSSVTASPGDIVRPALVHQCPGFVLLHNHPSGDPTPTNSDRSLTRKVKEAAELLELQMLDHVIVGHPSGHAAGTGYFSFRENGML